MIWSPARYAATFVLTALGAIILIALVIMATGINLGSAAVQFIPAIFAAMIEGQRYAKSGADAPSGPAMWRAAAAMTGIATGLLMLWTWTQLTLGGLAITGTMLVQVVALGILYFFANRWFFQMGYNAGSKRAR
ncbi:MAG: ABZJ_00895 family protein [Pseudomonadota bacterium]